MSEALEDQVEEVEFELDEATAAALLAGNGIRHPKKRAFLAAYARTGNVSAAARIVGMNRMNHYNWLREDERYADAFQHAEEVAGDYLEAVARQRATTGWLEPVYYQGEVVGHVRRFSDTLLIFLLKGARPEKFRERADVQHSGPGGGPIRVEPDYELSRRLMEDPELLELAERLAAAALEEPTAGALAPPPIPVASQEVEN